MSRYEVPVAVVTDRGRKFTSDHWATMYTKLNVHHRTTSSFHMEANGIIERFQRTLKQSLRAKCQSSSWTTKLPLILLGLRSTPREAGAILSLERILRVSPILPGDF